jgi:UDP-N-acetylmuramoyl-L-alanyl-D-glutamate--2,6-diaminopimelate ligase
MSDAIAGSLSVAALCHLPGVVACHAPAALEVQSIVVHPDDALGCGVLWVCIDEFLRYNQWLAGCELMTNCSLAQVALVVCEPQVEPPPGMPYLLVADTRRFLGHAARLLHGVPDQRMRVIGVTGTNGKTSTARLISHVLHQVEGSAASLGTLGAELQGVTQWESNYTTPLAPELQSWLAQLADIGARSAAIEVSSHALALDRVAGMRFAAAVITNVTRDHLDFHGSEEAYAAAKQRLFSMLPAGAPAIINRDSPHYEALAAACTGRVVSYSQYRTDADFVAGDVTVSPQQTQFVLVHRGLQLPVRTALIGRFQVENTLAALATVISLGVEPQAAVASIDSFPRVPGRMEPHRLPNGATAVVDYAHNPDGLRNLLENCRALNPQRILLVFGCGDRDRGKRPLMGALAWRSADLCWVTSDNPRTEDPLAIISEISAAFPADSEPYQVVDRTVAIRAACAAAQPGDIVVIAGKGHEDYQIIGRQKFAYSDQAVLRALGGQCAGCPVREIGR